MSPRGPFGHTRSGSGPAPTAPPTSEVQNCTVSPRQVDRLIAERDALAARLETEQVDHELVEFPDSSRTRRVLVRLGEALVATGGSATHEDRMLELCRLITALSRTLTTGGRDCD